MAAVESSIVVLNAGSSSIKFALYEAGHDERLRFRGQIDGIGVDPHLKARDVSGEVVAEKRWGKADLEHRSATTEILTLVRRLLAGRPVVGVGHRVVHGGTDFAGPVRIDRDVIASLKKLAPLAPLHQPHNLTPIEAIAAHRPDLPQVACFDTAFHRSQPEVAQAYALPREMTAAGIRRYGFHGLSYDFIVSRLSEIEPALAKSRLVIAHLGNGASLCAVAGGRSVASTMGFTAVEGLMMGTRCGALDPGVLLYLLDQRGFDARRIEDLLYRQSGLLGVSGLSSDMRTLRQSTAFAAHEAIDLFVYRIIREIGSMVAALGGIDALIFTAGIGENDPLTREAVVAGCTWLGLELDEMRNACGDGRISTDRARVSAWVIPTDEERMIARSTNALLAALPTVSGEAA
jgi:acetate kinase